MALVYVQLRTSLNIPTLLLARSGQKPRRGRNCGHSLDCAAPQAVLVIERRNRIQRVNRALQIRQILLTRGLTLYGVSQKSAEVFGRSSEFSIPPNLYSILDRTPRVPTICQAFALSRLTNYRLSDWLAVFGFDLDAIPKLRLLHPRRHTTILDSTVYDPYAPIPCFTAKVPSGPLPPIAPLRQFLVAAPARRAIELSAQNERKFLYAVVGEQDVYAFPQFAPGSVIRADPSRTEPNSGSLAVHGKTFFLVEHELGWTCSRLVPTGGGRVLLDCPQWPCAEQEFSIGKDARILGAIDAEIRPIAPQVSGILKSRPLSFPRERPATLLSSEATLRVLLRQSRERAGLSFREASELSRQIAAALSDELYFAASSTLSDYETLVAPPRQVHKIITLCALYAIGFDQFLRACGFSCAQAGREPIPEGLVTRHGETETLGRATRPEQDTQNWAGSPEPILDPWNEIPLFLSRALDELSGLKNLSLSNLFWVGSDKSPRHPMLVDAVLVAVNRRARKLPPRATTGACGGPVHLILVRDGRYLCGPCTHDGDNLVIGAYPRSGLRTQEFKIGIDAEIVGQVTAILRRLRG